MWVSPVHETSSALWVTRVVVATNVGLLTAYMFVLSRYYDAHALQHDLPEDYWISFGTFVLAQATITGVVLASRRSSHQLGERVLAGTFFSLLVCTGLLVLVAPLSR